MLLRIAWELDSFAIAQNSSPGNFEKLPYPLKTLTPGGEKAAQLSCVQFLLGGAFQKKKLQKKPNLTLKQQKRHGISPLPAHSNGGGHHKKAPGSVPCLGAFFIRCHSGTAWDEWGSSDLWGGVALRAGIWLVRREDAAEMQPTFGNIQML